LTAFLSKLQRDGALQGATAAKAFYVKCDAENNPPELRDLGQVVIEIGLAPLSPAEFIVVRIVRRAGGSPDN
jgi:phage tail sheath protein FI